MEAKLRLEDELLLVLRDQLFDGSWERMERDLRDRAAWCHPNDEVERQVACDLERIARLKVMELSGADLATLRSLGA